MALTQIDFDVTLDNIEESSKCSKEVMEKMIKYRIKEF